MTQSDNDAAPAGRDVVRLLFASRSVRLGEAETTFRAQIGRKRAAMMVESRVGLFAPLQVGEMSRELDGCIPTQV